MNGCCWRSKRVLLFPEESAGFHLSRIRSNLELLSKKSIIGVLWLLCCILFISFCHRARVIIGFVRIGRGQKPRPALRVGAGDLGPVPLVGGHRRQLRTAAPVEQALDDLEFRIVVGRSRILIQIEAGKPPAIHGVLDIPREHPEEERVAEDVAPAAVQEHRRDGRQPVDRIVVHRAYPRIRYLHRRSERRTPCQLAWDHPEVADGGRSVGLSSESGIIGGLRPLGPFVLSS